MYQPDRKMLELLVCPVTGGSLTFAADADDPRLAWLVSTAASIRFPVRDGVPILVQGEAEPLDDPLLPEHI